MSDAGKFTGEQLAKRTALKDALERFSAELRDLNPEIRDLRYEVFTQKKPARRPLLDEKEARRDDLKANVQRIHAELGSMPRVKTMPERFLACAEMILPKAKFDEIMDMALVRDEQ